MERVGDRGAEAACMALRDAVDVVGIDAPRGPGAREGDGLREQTVGEAAKRWQRLPHGAPSSAARIARATHLE